MQIMHCSCTRVQLISLLNSLLTLTANTTTVNECQGVVQDFYEDIFEELAKFGEIENLNVCDNLADHMVGSVYVKFSDEEGAAAALQGLQGRFYGGRPIQIEFSPVTDFREATCRQYEENTCTRGGYCNFMHLRPISRDLRKSLFGRYKRKERVEDDRRDNRGGPRGGPRDDFRDRRRDRSPGGGGDRRGRSDKSLLPDLNTACVAAHIAKHSITLPVV